MGILRKVFNWYGGLGPRCGIVKPPYDHVVQVGDPRLRQVSEKVPLEEIKSNYIQNLINHLRLVLDRYNCVGLSAPQIGVNKRIFVMRQTAKQIAKTSSMLVTYRGIVEVPFTVFINPTVKVIDFCKVSHTEGCESVRMYCADVPRFKEIEITGLNADGETFCRHYKDWPARIAQHELDHLDGKMYTDIMDRKTLTCSCWEEVNVTKGRIAVPFYPD